MLYVLNMFNLLTYTSEIKALFITCIAINTTYPNPNIVFIFFFCTIANFVNGTIKSEEGISPRKRRSKFL